jgi:hypothetical protein
MHPPEYLIGKRFQKSGDLHPALYLSIEFVIKLELIIMLLVSGWFDNRQSPILVINCFSDLIINGN